MSDKRVFLKVKIKSLAEEASIIRMEENKRSVHYFRKNMVRNGESVAGAKERVLASRRKRLTKPWYPLTLEQLQELHLHRVGTVRKESRLTLIAYSLVRGKNVADSMKELTKDDWERIVRMVKKYGDEASTRVAVALQSRAAEGSSPSGASKAA